MEKGIELLKKILKILQNKFGRLKKRIDLCSPKRGEEIEVLKKILKIFKNKFGRLKKRIDLCSLKRFTLRVIRRENRHIEIIEAELGYRAIRDEVTIV